MGIVERATFGAAIVGVLALQGALITYFEPPRIVLDTTPASRADLDTHVEQTWRVTEALDRWGKSWAYDVQLLAGYPNGTIFDADNKGWELWTFALWKMGVPRGLAFNLFIVLAHLMVPWTVMAAARQFRLGWWASLGAAVLAMACWYFDIFPHRCWWIGMVAYGMAGYLFLLPMALMYRYVADGGWWRAALLGATMAAGHLVHPYIFMMLVAPMLTIYARGARKMPWQRHLGVVAAVAVTLAANAYWLVVAIRFWHYILDSGYFGQSTLSYLVTDYFGMMRDIDITGYVANRTGFRILALGGGVAALVVWYKERDDRFMPFAVGLGLMLALTYLGGYTWVTRQVQPYRHVLPAIYLGVIPAAAFVEHLHRSGTLARIPRMAWGLIVVVALVALPHLVRDVAYFIPELVPDMPEAAHLRPTIEEKLGITAVAPFRKAELRRGAPHAGFKEIADWVDLNDDGQGRFLVQWGFLGEHLAWRTKAQILGGFIKRNMSHAMANLFRRDPDVTLSDAELKEYLETYAVKWIIVSHPKPMLEDRKHMLVGVFWFPPHRVYRTDVPISFFEEGSGSVQASLNRIEVTGTKPDEDLVLRYHYLETLVCKPGCSVEREPLEHDPVGFIRVPAPHPADLVIENGY